MKSLVVSDLHLEGSNMVFEIDDDIELLLFCGDVCVNLEYGFDFMSRVKKNARAIFIPGNHEYEGKDIFVANDKMRKLAKEYGIELLINESILHKDYVIIGSTLWSGFNLFAGEKKNSMDAAKFGVSDFSTIFLNKKLLNPVDMEFMHIEAINFIDSELKRHKDKNIIVASHFAPFKGSLNDSHKHEYVSSYWVNDLEEKFSGLCEYWFHGHTHDTFNYDINGTIVRCNPRGFSKTFDLSSNNKFSLEPIVLNNVLTNGYSKKFKV